MRKFMVTFFLIGTLIFVSKIYASSNKTTNYTYHINSTNIEKDLSCWVGWKKYHYGETEVLAMKGDSYTFPGSPTIRKRADGTVEFHEGVPYTIDTKGYGLYSLSLSQVLSLLEYIKDNIDYSDLPILANDKLIKNYETKYIPSNLAIAENFIKNGKIKLSDAIDIAKNDMIDNQFSESYKEGEFKKFWKGVFIKSEEENLRKIQNKFYYKTYAESAFNTLQRMMGDYFDNLSSEQKEVLKSVVFSIMEAKNRKSSSHNNDINIFEIRRKNLKNKEYNNQFTINTSERELLPFLVYIENLDMLYDKSERTNMNSSNVYYEFPPFDMIIEGAYQWMLYNADGIVSESNNKLKNNENPYLGIDWEGEFFDLTLEAFPVLYEENLEDFYDRCKKVNNLFKNFHIDSLEHLRQLINESRDRR